MSKNLKKVLRALLPTLPAVGVLLFAGLCRLWPAVGEYLHARGLFRVLSAVLGTLTQWVPVSLTEWLLFLSPVLLIALVIWLWRRRVPGRAVIRGVAWVLSGAFALYMLMHGLNYARLPLADQMGMTVSADTASVAELKALAIRCAREASAARERCEEDENGCFTMDQPLSATLSGAAAGYEALEADHPFLWGAVNRAKGVIHSHQWSYTGITGMYFPLLAEANVNVDVPDSGLPHTVAHELAHTRGYAHEDECNFLAHLACVNHPDPRWQYAGWLTAYIYVSNAVYTASVPAWEEISAHCSPGMIRDLIQRTEYWQAFEGPVQEMSSAVNDAFIQANGDTEGVARYGLVTRLLLAYYAA